LNRKILIFIAFLSLFFTECKKYPEDDSISLRTAKTRLLKNSWKVNEVLLNGNNINSMLNDSLNLADIEELQLRFGNTLEESAESRDRVGYTYNGNSDYFEAYGGWKFYDKKKYLSLDHLTSDKGGADLSEAKILNGVFASFWTIIKLHKEELKIKNTKGYEITLNSVR